MSTKTPDDTPSSIDVCQPPTSELSRSDLPQAQARMGDEAGEPTFSARRGRGTDPCSLAPDDFSFLASPQAPDEIGRLGNYRVLHLLGKGGMAYVFRAEDLTLGRAVALKVMKPHVDAGRFLREAQNLARIKHDHLVTIYQVDQVGQVAFIAMELLEGNPLDRWVEQHGVPSPEEVVQIGKEIAAGLAAIHRKNLIHRDIKPGNLFRDAESERIKILDFGLSRHIDEDTNITVTGIVVGTPAFMSPEQARGDRLDARTDLFSLGSVLYFLCTGVHPFDGKKTMAVLTALAVETPRPAHELNPKVPLALSNLVARLLSKSPEQRPASAQEVVEILRELQGNRPSSTGTQALAQSTQVLPPAALVLPSDAATSFWLRYRWRIVAGAFAAFALTVLATLGLLVLILPPPPPPPPPPDWGGERFQGRKGFKGMHEGKKGPGFFFEAKKGPPDDRNGH